MAENRVKEVIAKCNIKYDKDLYIKGATFKVRATDLKELIDRGFVYLKEEEDSDSGNKKSNGTDGSNGIEKNAGTDGAK